MGVQQQNAPVTKPKATKPMSEARRIRKPLMERKRRERINTCLNDLASLLIDAKMVKTEPGKPTKLEKADILELTVKHIKNLKGQEKIAPASETEDDKPTSSYKEGFSKCMGMVDQTLGKAGKEALRQRLLSHLKVCLKSFDPPSPPEEEVKDPKDKKEESTLPRKAESDISPAISKSNSVPESNEVPESKEASTKESAAQLTLVPTRLPSGGVAFVIKGGIDPSLLLPQRENLEEITVVPNAVSPPPSPAACDSSMSSPSATPRISAVPSSCSVGLTSLSVSRGMASNSPPPLTSQPTSSHVITADVSSQTTCTTSNMTHPYDPQPYIPTQYEYDCQSSDPYSQSFYAHECPSPTYHIPSSTQTLPTNSHVSQPLAKIPYPVSSNSSLMQSIPHHTAPPQNVYNPPTPPPSISPTQNIQPINQYQHYQPVSSEEDMDTDGLSEEEIDIGIENDVPYDLSMRRIWRFW